MAVVGIGVREGVLRSLAEIGEALACSRVSVSAGHGRRVLMRVRRGVLGGVVVVIVVIITWEHSGR